MEVLHTSVGITNDLIRIIKWRPWEPTSDDSCVPSHDLCNKTQNSFWDFLGE